MGGVQEEEVTYLSSHSGSSTDETDDEMLEGRERVMASLRLFIWGEGAMQIDRDKKKSVLRELELFIRHMALVGKRTGYRKAQSLNAKHVKDLEDLFEVERRERKRLEEERMRMGEDMKKVMRDQMERALLNGRWGNRNKRRLGSCGMRDQRRGRR